MRTFVKDYVDLCKENCKFYKKHWFGVIVMNVAATAGILAYYGRDEIKDKLEEKFGKKRDEDEEEA